MPVTLAGRSQTCARLAAREEAASARASSGRLAEPARLSRLVRTAVRTEELKAAVSVSDCACRLLKCSSARASAICAAGVPAQHLGV
jgi:hypothetical protein